VHEKSKKKKRKKRKKGKKKKEKKRKTEKTRKRKKCGTPLGGAARGKQSLLTARTEWTE
jgi:hypothetical protein